MNIRNKFHLCDRAKTRMDGFHVVVGYLIFKKSDVSPLQYADEWRKTFYKIISTEFSGKLKWNNYAL